MSVRLMIKTMLRRKVVTTLLLVQLALTLALILNSMVLAKQTHERLQEPTGLDLANTLLVQIKPTTPTLRLHPALGELLERQLEAIRQLPGVVAVAYTNQSPLLRGGNNGNLYKVGDEERNNVSMVPQYYASADIFQVLGVELKSGQLPQVAQSFDSDSSPPLVLTESVAKKLFESDNPIGQATNQGTIAAVVSDFYGQREADMGMYNTIRIAPLYGVDWGYSLLLRVEPQQVVSVRSQLDNLLRQVDSNIEIFHIRTLQEQHQRLYNTEYGLSVLLALLSALMLLVTMISGYSNAHFHVLKSQKEIGIKRALGANKATILLELLAEGWLCTVLGGLLGVAAAVLLNQALALVISIPVLNGWLVVLTLLLLLLCVTLATWYPARIATRISPATATKTL